MPFVTIDVRGEATVHGDTPTSDRIRHAVEGGTDQVHGMVDTLAAHVNGDGFVIGLPRNVVGSVTLWCLGMPEQPYAGVVVLTGWDPEGRTTEVCDLAPQWLETLPRVVRDIRLALGLEEGVPSRYAPPWWMDTVRQTAVMVEQAPTPTMEVVSINPVTGEWTKVDR